MFFTKLAKIHCLGKGRLDFGDIDLIFKVHIVSVRYLLNQSMDFDQTRIDTLLGEGELLIRFW